jgi:hypothetical protein
VYADKRKHDQCMISAQAQRHGQIGTRSLPVSVLYMVQLIDASIEYYYCYYASMATCRRRYHRYPVLWQLTPSARRRRQCLHASASVPLEPHPQLLQHVPRRVNSMIAQPPETCNTEPRTTNETVLQMWQGSPCISPSPLASSPNASSSSSSASSSSSSPPGQAVFAAGSGATSVAASPLGVSHSASPASASKARLGAPPTDGLRQQQYMHWG